MLKKILLVLFFTASLFVSDGFAQKVYTPAKGSAERTAIFNILRVPIEKELKQKVQFSAKTFQAQGDWAFIFGDLQNPSGGDLNFKRTKYQEAIEAGMFDSNFQALLKKTGGKWKVITYLIGCTDVCWETWASDYNAPKVIFQMH